MNIVKIIYPRLITYIDSIEFIKTSPELVYVYITKYDIPHFIYNLNRNNYFYHYSNMTEYINIDAEIFPNEYLYHIRNAILYRIRDDKLKFIELL